MDPVKIERDSDETSYPSRSGQSFSHWLIWQRRRRCTVWRPTVLDARSGVTFCPSAGKVYESQSASGGRSAEENSGAGAFWWRAHFGHGIA